MELGRCVRTYRGRKKPLARTGPVALIEGEEVDIRRWRKRYRKSAGSAQVD